MRQFVVKSTSSQQASQPGTWHRLEVLLVVIDHAITPINFQSPLVKHALISADMIFGETARYSCALCRKSECLAQAVDRPEKNVTSESNFLFMCNIFHEPECYRDPRLPFCTSPRRALQRSDWMVGEPIGGWAASYLNSPHTTQPNPDNILWLLKHHSLTSVCHHPVCSATAPVGTERRGRNIFLTLFFLSLPLHLVHPGWEPAASVYTWKSTDAPVDQGKLCVFNHDQSCWDEVRHSASFWGPPEDRWEEQTELWRPAAEQFNGRAEDRPAAMPEP